MTRDDDPVTMADAAQHFGFTVSTLRAEAGRGRLVMFKIGKRYYTTPNAIRAMVELCRVEPKAPVSGFRRDMATSSETERRSTALAALKLKLNNPSPATSRPNTPRSRHARH
jgi:hypothetical protein